MELGEEFGIFGSSWARIHFIENEGMAFGMKLGGSMGKLLLTVFRIVAVFFIGYYLSSLIRNNASKSLIISIALVFAGALGNIVDSVFYGVLFDKGMLINPLTGYTAGYDGIAHFSANGYAGIFHGNVVDMFYFPIAHGHYPQWLPFFGGKEFSFFRPVFNLADSSITIGVLSILIFQRSIFGKKQKTEVTTHTAANEHAGESNP